MVVPESRLGILTFYIILSVCDRFPGCYGKLPGMLYPRDTESRAIRRLDGMWNFAADFSLTRMKGFDEQWYNQPLDEVIGVIPMPVPSSYNDITDNKALRDFVGWAWYDREFFIDRKWTDVRIVLRIDSAHYNTVVWVNGQQVLQHEGGHLPFEADVTGALYSSAANRVTVAINNTLTPTTLPPGTIEYKTNTHRYPSGYFVQNLQMDFFNYAGIHRHVTLYTTPTVYIEDIDIITDIQGTDGIVNYVISIGGQATGATIKVEVLDKGGHVVAMGIQMTSSLTIPDVTLWWPYTMKPQTAAYLYTLLVTLTPAGGGPTDVYRQHFGVRTVAVTDTQLLINNKPFYCHGVAKHEDADIRGKGLDYPLIARDFVMLKWLGVNCFRTSHYPYAEEIMDEADRQGIVVIDESPGVGIGKTNRKSKGYYKHRKIKGVKKQQHKHRRKNKGADRLTKLRRLELDHCRKRKSERCKNLTRLIEKHMKGKRRRRKMRFALSSDENNFSNKSLQHHKAVMSEMYQRDKNRPAVIIWSVANEPSTNKQASGPYFKAVIDHVKSLDSHRPVTFVCNQEYYKDVALQYVDIVMVNKYYAWYSDVGHTEVIGLQLLQDMRGYHTTFNRPVVLTEYGADTIAGFHQEPSFVFTEEYQVDFLTEYHKAFDVLRKEFFVGEMVWNFADFMTKEGITRVVGNKKGLLTRQRQPKMSAHVIRDRYMALMTGHTSTCNWRGI